MRRLFSALSLSRGGRWKRSSRANDRSHQAEESRGFTPDPQSSSSASAGGFERVNRIAMDSQNNLTSNIILNHDFSGGLRSWHPNGCHAYVVSMGPHASNSLALKSGQCYAVVTKRTESWQGLEQDITEQVSPGSTYVLSAHVKVSGALEGSTAVQATLKLENRDSPTGYLFVGSTSVLKEQWGKVEGTFSLSSKPSRVVLYLEGPPSGVDLLISSVVVFPSSDRQFEHALIRGFQPCTSAEEKDQEGALQSKRHLIKPRCQSTVPLLLIPCLPLQIPGCSLKYKRQCLWP